jgi:hypothetical protein
MNSVLESVRGLGSAVDAALPRPAAVAALSDAEIAAVMSELGAITRKVTAASSLVATDIGRRSARELGADGLAQSQGARSGPEFVQKLTGLSIAESRRLARTGELLEAAEAVAPEPGARPGPRDLDALRGLGGGWRAPIAVAVRNEWLSAAESDALRAGLGEPPSAAHADRWRQATLELVADAWASEWPAEELGRAARRMRAALDAVTAHEDAQARFEARGLKRRRLQNGNWKWDLEVDPETDAALWAPLSKRLSPRLGGPRFRTEEELARAAELEQDPRSNEQLLLDAFVGIFGAGVAASAASGGFGAAEPHVSIVVTADELRRAKNAGTTGRAGIAWVDGQPISALTALRAICDGSFTPVLFDESGQAIDVGKDQRVFTARQRRALAVRDGGCRWAGCERPAHECEAHHINPWAERVANRKTEAKDGMLLCRFHHLTLHNHDAKITRRGNDFWLHWPGRPPVLLSSKSGAMTQLKIAGRERRNTEERAVAHVE